MRRNAYAPYSSYPVGAAIEGPDGRTWAGANFENVSFGATICAERAAVAGMVAEGGKEISRLAVVTADGGTPCGACLQVLLEFAPDPHNVDILVSDDSGNIAEYKLAELIPHGFGSAKVKRT